MPNQTKHGVIIIGAGGHALVVADALRRQGEAELLGFLDPDRKRHGQTLAGAGILGDFDFLSSPTIVPGTRVIVATGRREARLREPGEVAKLGILFVTVVHPAAIVSASAEIGPGVFVAAGAVVGPQCRIGGHGIINTGVLLEVGVVIEQGAHIAPGAVVGGWVTVGRGAMVGLGAIVGRNLAIGAGATVGAGACVDENVLPGVTVVGRPARIFKP